MGFLKDTQASFDPVSGLGLEAHTAWCSHSRMVYFYFGHGTPQHTVEIIDSLLESALLLPRGSQRLSSRSQALQQVPFFTCCASWMAQNFFFLLIFITLAGSGLECYRCSFLSPYSPQDQTRASTNCLSSSHCPPKNEKLKLTL